MKILNLVFVVLFVGSLLHPVTDFSAHQIPDSKMIIVDDYDDIDHADIVSEISIEIIVAYISNTFQDAGDTNNQVKGIKSQYLTASDFHPTFYFPLNYQFIQDNTLSVDIPPPKISV